MSTSQIVISKTVEVYTTFDGELADVCISNTTTKQSEGYIESVDDKPNEVFIVVEGPKKGQYKRENSLRAIWADIFGGQMDEDNLA